METYIQKYNLKKYKIDDMIIELRNYGIQKEWSKSKLKRKKKELRNEYENTMKSYNKWLKGFGKPEMNVYRDAKIILKNEIFTSIVDVSEGNFINHKNEIELKKYLRNNPNKSYSRKLAKDKGYKVFLKIVSK